MLLDMGFVRKKFVDRFWICGKMELQTQAKCKKWHEWEIEGESEK